MRILKRIGLVLLALVVLVAIAYPFRRDPIGPLAGKRLWGEEIATPITDWSFSDNHPTIALEARPEDPHSVTTVCFVVEGRLYVPAQDGSEKKWTHYVLEDQRVRVKIGDAVYPGLATRITDETIFDSFLEAARVKYPRLAGSVEELPEDLWLFRVDSHPR